MTAVTTPRGPDERHQPDPARLAPARTEAARGRWSGTRLPDISTDMSFLEMLDVVNERLIKAGDEPIAFDHDCREGICGTCGLMINGIAHGPQRATTVCQLHMRHFKDGDTIYHRAVAGPGRSRSSRT